MSAHAAAGTPVLAASHATFARKARTFYWASLLLPRDARNDAAIVYALCREVDDTADESHDPIAAACALDCLAAEVQGVSPARPLVAAFRSTAQRLDLPLSSALELIEGVRSDLGPVRIADDAELLRYCYRVAATVGLMMCAVLKVRSRDALPYAVDLGVAMQLTNIVRDVAEDALLGRVYLPAHRLQRAGVDPDALVRGTAEARAVAAVVAELLALADTFYRSADGGMRDIPWRARQAILVASRVYRAIGLRLRRQACDALAGRTVVPWPGKLLWGSQALIASLHPRILGLAPRLPHDASLHAALRGLPGSNAG
ncbi:phytoene/squalene synthase family protein [soil metagenome]|nr:phytoene/squalene synthase family protein [Gemmatimonadota bacterium]